MDIVKMPSERVLQYVLHVTINPLEKATSYLSAMKYLMQKGFLYDHHIQSRSILS